MLAFKYTFVVVNLYILLCSCIGSSCSSYNHRSTLIQMWTHSKRLFLSKLVQLPVTVYLSLVPSPSCPALSLRGSSPVPTLMEQPDGDVDLYSDPVNEGESQMVVNNDQSPCSLIWTTMDDVSPTIVKTHSNGTTASFPPRELLTSRNSSDSKRPSWRSPGATRLGETNSEPQSLQVDPIEALKSEDGNYNLCSCVQNSDYCSYCSECKTLHDETCAVLKICRKNLHNVKQVKKMQSGGLRSPTIIGSSAAVSSLPLSEDPASIIALPPAIAYHECCNLNNPDPQILCHECRVFHLKSCSMAKSCQSLHRSTQLGKCSSCDRWCSRKPLVLCRYCGNELCSACWYRNPLTCSCGQTFDQSTSV